MKKCNSNLLRKAIVLLLSVLMVFNCCFSVLAISYAGDFDNDGALRANDIVNIRNAFLEVEDFTDSEFVKKYDVNGDGVVDARDIVGLKKEVAYFVEEEKFEAKEITEIGNADAVLLSELFNSVEGVKIDSSRVKVKVDTDVTYKVNTDTENWENSSILFDGTGSVTVTISEYCIPTSVTVNLVKEVKFEINDSLPSVFGNAKNTTVGALFNLKSGYTPSSNMKVTAETVSGDVEAAIGEINVADWQNTVIDFNGTGSITITIEDNSQPASVTVTVDDEVKFAENDGASNEYGNASIITVGTLFEVIEGYTVDSSKVNVTAKKNSGDVTCEIVLDKENWQEGKLEFDGTGSITLTIIEESKPTDITITVIDADKFSLKVDDPYTVENTQNVVLGDIFAELVGVDVDSDKVAVNISKVNEEDTVAWSFAEDKANWTNGVIDFSGAGQVTVTIEEDSNSTTLTIIVKSIDKFVAVKGVSVTETDTKTLGELFNKIDGVTVDSSKVVVNVAGGTYTADVNDWENGTITFTTPGTATVTIEQDSNVATATVTVTKREPIAKFAVKFTNTEKYLYRVGNANTVALGSLFRGIVSTDEIKTVSATIETLNGTSASGTFTANSDWTKATIKFSGTGVVKVTITDNYYCVSTELKLEVIDAWNTTSVINVPYTDSTTNKSYDVVLLNDCGFSSIEVTQGYTLHGNGFTMTCSKDSAALDMGYSFVSLNNGTLDNVQIVCPNYDYAALYKSNLTSSENRSETTDKTRYYNAKSGVMASGNSQILNSRISGGRASLNVSSGNVVVDNSRIELGVVANILVGSANSLKLRDVTLIQKPAVSTYDSTKTLMGFSVLYMCDSEGNAAPTTLEGSFVQQAWVCEDDKQYVPSAGQDIVAGVMKEEAFLHSINGKDSLNLGFAYMPEDPQKTVAAPNNITDNRTDKATIPYELKDVNISISILSTTVYVYSYKNSNGTADSFKTETVYVPNKNSDIITVSYSDVAEGLTTGRTFGTDGWVFELNVDLDKLPGYALDFSKISLSINGVSVNDFKVNGADKPASPVTVTAGGIVYKLTTTINGKEYTVDYKVIGTETSKESPSLVGTPSYAAGFGVANSYGGDWSAAAPVLDGITVKYWSVADSKYKEFPLSSITFSTKGKQSGTNSYWEYVHTNNDFTLKLTNTVAIHSGKSVFGMPVVGSDGKLYFTISSSSGFVGSGTTSRSITIAYEFTDNNGGTTLKFNHTWSIAYDKESQYNYDSFVNDGTMTKLTSSSGGGCVTPDTLITLADGTQKRVDSLTGEEMLLVWNLETGKYDVAPIVFVDSDKESEFEIVHLYFSDGSDVKVIFEHGFFDIDLGKYVYIDATNYADYIGHRFIKEGDISNNDWNIVTLDNVVVEKEITTAWSPVTFSHLCYFTNGLLSMPGGIDGLFNIFDVNTDTMSYDEDKMQKDIETYGLFSYEDFGTMISEVAFEAFNGKYLKIAIGKGMITWEDIAYLAERYMPLV